MGRGRDVAPYLRSFGIVDSIPSIRSSDFGTAIERPFLYYLTRRLNLAPANRMEEREAIIVGDYFHLLMELEHLGPENQKRLYYERLKEQITEIVRVCEMTGKRADYSIEKAEQLAYSTEAMYHAVLDYKLPGTELSRGIKHLLEQEFQELGDELLLSYRHKDFPRSVLTIQVDRLLYRPASDEVWILDYKTSGKDTVERLATCTYEAQTRHYVFTLRELMPKIIEEYGLPRSAKVGGMMHLAIKRPDLRLTDADRPFEYQSEGKRTGWVGSARPIYNPNLSVKQWDVECRSMHPPFDSKADSFQKKDDALTFLHEATGKKPEKVYTGERDVRLLTRRIKEKYRDMDPASPPVNLSRTPIDAVLDEDGEYEYLSDLKAVYSYATRPANPVAFSRRTGLSKTDRWYPFHVAEPAQWPDLIRLGGLVQYQRDNENDKQ